jgi:hypothetical protein
MPKPKRHFFRWILLALFLGAIAWIAISDNPFAGDLLELSGWQPDQPVLDSSFSVAARSFRYYKFSLPNDSKNLSITGEFTVSATAPPSSALNSPASSATSNAVSSPTSNGQSAPNATSNDPDANNIQVLVLTESSFAAWQSGNPTSGSVYESGKLSQGRVQAELPAGPGIYFLIFNNRFSPHAAKKLQASVFLRYKSWLPGWFARMHASHGHNGKSK